MHERANDPLDPSHENFLAGDLRVDVGQQRVTRANNDLAVPHPFLQRRLPPRPVAPHLPSNELQMARVWPGVLVHPGTVNKRVKEDGTRWKAI